MPVRKLPLLRQRHIRPKLQSKQFWPRNWVEERGIEAAKDFDIHLELAKVANAMQTMVDEKHEIEELTEKNLKTTRNAFYIGRSIDYDTAIEAALKLKEVSRSRLKVLRPVNLSTVRLP